MRVSILVILLSVLIFPFSTFSAESEMAAEELFQSTSLGTNGKSCSACHPQGKGLENIGDYDDATLQEFVNFCIRDALKGKMLPEGSEELQILASYLRRFQKPQ